MSVGHSCITYLYPQVKYCKMPVQMIVQMSSSVDLENAGLHCVLDNFRKGFPKFSEQLFVTSSLYGLFSLMSKFWLMICTLLIRTKIFQGIKSVDNFPESLDEVFSKENLKLSGLSENLLEVYCYEMKNIIDNAVQVNH